MDDKAIGLKAVLEKLQQTVFLSVFPLQLCHLTLATSLLQFNQLMQPVLSFVSRWSFFSISLNVFSTEQSVVVLLFVRFQRWAEIASHAVEMHPLIR